MMKNLSTIIAGLCLFLASCSSDSEDVLTTTPAPGGGGSTCDTSSVTFAGSITPLLNSYGCTNCHSGTNPPGNITLTSYNGVKAKINDGRLWGAINHLPGFRPMPEGGNKMNNCDINKFRAWINRGALNN
jgi:hypothetical protein